MNPETFKSILIEVRPLLQSVNTFVNLNNSSDETQVKVERNKLEICINDVKNELEFTEFDILPNSLSNMQSNDSCLYFRFSTNTSSKLGTFKTEILQTESDTNNFNSSETFLNTSDLYSIKCSNCQQAFCKDINFKRVLPLPSDLSNHNDWFCHAHSESKATNLDPSPLDVFYSNCYVHLNKCHLTGVISSSVNIICKRCLQWVGIVINEDTRKVWFNTVIFCTEVEAYTSNPLQDCMKTVASNVQDNLISSNKLLLQCQVSTKEVNYLLLWVMEKKLKIYLFNNGQKQVSQVSKVLFKFVNGDANIVEQWLKNFSVPNVTISKTMMTAIVKHLYEMNSYIPKMFAVSNNFYLSYI